MERYRQGDSKREKTLGKKNDSRTGGAVGQDDLRSHNREARRLYGRPRGVERNSPLQDGTVKTQMTDAPEAWRRDLRMSGCEEKVPVRENGQLESRAANAAQKNAAKKDRPEPAKTYPCFRAPSARREAPDWHRADE